MVYCKAPDGALSKPSRVLIGFAKTGNIPEGEEERVTITAPVRRFASFDDDCRTGFGTTGYVLEKGTYEFFLGSDFISASPVGSFDLSDNRLLALTVTAHTARAKKTYLLRQLTISNHALSA